MLIFRHVGLSALAFIHQEDLPAVNKTPWYGIMLDIFQLLVVIALSIRRMQVVDLKYQDIQIEL